jgi:RNA polymerase sigma-70 factor (ECF subfamily)
MTDSPTLDADSSVFEALVVPLVVPAYELAYAMLHDRQEAEDAVQEAALKAWRGFRGFRGSASWRSWFLTIVANHCRSVRRGRWRALVLLPVVLGPGTLPDDHLADATDLRRAVHALPTRQRLALFLFYYLDLPLDEVATILGLNAVPAKSLLARAIRNLRAVMIPEESV